MYNVIEKLIEAKDEIEWQICCLEREGKHVPASLRIMWNDICELIDKAFEM